MVEGAKMNLVLVVAVALVLPSTIVAHWLQPPYSHPTLSIDSNLNVAIANHTTNVHLKGQWPTWEVEHGRHPTTIDPPRVAANQTPKKPQQDYYYYYSWYWM